MRSSEASSRRFRVVHVTLPKAAEHEQEVVPILLDDRSGLPLRLAMRWVMRSRRSVVGEKTLADDLRGASLLYAFSEDVLGWQLDELFADGHRLNAAELEQLIDYLREGRGGTRGIRALSTTGQLISNIERFLRWLANPLDRGGTTYVTPEDLVLYREQLAHAFADTRAGRSRGQRKQPLTPEQDLALASLIGPVKRRDGKYEAPLRFQEANPWKPHTRLRNWIGYQLSRELGLRRGEVGKIRIDDVRSLEGQPCVAIRRRPHDAADTRKSGNRPKVKTVERELPISELLLLAIRQYTHTLLRDGGRRGANTPYLLVTGNGSPISGSSLDAIWHAVNSAMNLRLSWHVLRHTWAEETADALLEDHQGAIDSSEVVLGILRELGGWAPASSSPFLYIKNALKKRGDAYLRKRNAKFDSGLANV